MKDEKKTVGRDAPEPKRSGRSCKTSELGSDGRGSENPPGFSRGECQYVLLAFLAVMIFGIGFFCGYDKDKEEVVDDLRTAKEYFEEAEKSLNEAQRLLDEAYNYYEEVHAELKVIAGMIREE